MTRPKPPERRRSQVPELTLLVRRVIGPRVPDAAIAEDLTQETLARLTAIEARLDPGVLGPYAVATARNVVRGWARRQERERRHNPRVLDVAQPEGPEERVLEEEERRTMVSALRRLPATEREVLLAHDVEGLQTKALAAQLETTPGALAVRLSRARARLRVEYVLVLRRVQLPSTSCKRVLLAISAGDKRQQRQAGVGDHLLNCAVCAELSAPLAERRRPLAALWPFLGLDHVLRWLRRTARSHPAPTAGAGVAGTAVAVWAVVALTGGSPEPTLFVQAGSSIALSGDRPMASYQGRPVEARGVRVQSVVGSDGFWVGDSVTDRVWVDVHDQALRTHPLAPGQRVNFQGQLVPNTPQTLERAGGGGPDDRAQLERQGYHVDVAAETVQPARSPG